MCLARKSASRIASWNEGGAYGRVCSRYFQLRSAFRVCSNQSPFGHVAEYPRHCPFPIVDERIINQRFNEHESVNNPSLPSISRLSAGTIAFMNAAAVQDPST